MRLKQLKERQAALVRDCKAILEKAQKENRDLSADEKTAYDKNELELGAKSADGKAATGIYADIEREERLAAFERDLMPTAENKAGQTAEQLAEQSGKPKPVRIEGVYSKPKHFKTAEEAYLCGRYIRAALSRRPDDVQWCKEHGLNMLAASGAHSSSNNASSGVFVPDPMLNSVIELREMYGVLRPNATVVPMTSDTLTMPRWVSGLTVYYPNENVDITASKTAHNMVTLSARKYAALAVYPQELIDDAVISFADLFAKEIAEAFSKAEDTNGFNGDGTSTYGGTFGITVKINDGGHAASISTSATGNTAFETLDLSDFNNVLAKCPKYARANAKWYISSAGYEASMARLQTAAGGNTTMTLASGAVVRQFLGYPVEEVQVMNSTLTAQTSTIVALFGDLSKAVMLGDRNGISIAADSSRYFEADQVAMKATQRIDIAAHSLGDGSTAGPVIALKTASS